MTEDYFFSWVGTAGGVILAGGLMPQIYLAHKRRSAKDISYLWQGIYITGLVTLLVYYHYFELWAIFYPVCVEFLCVAYLTGLKIYFEKFPKRTQRTAQDEQSSLLPGGDRL